MPKASTPETLAIVLAAALLRFGVGTAVFESSELDRARTYSLRCRLQANGSIAVSLEMQRSRD
jgi:hypothetical protein